MAEITMDRGAYEALKGDVSALGADSKIASFLVNKFEEGEQEAKASRGEDPSWTYIIWTWRFKPPIG